MLNTTIKLTHVTPVPGYMSREDALSRLHDAENHIKSDPNLTHWNPRTPQVPPTVPEDVDAIATTESYTVIDTVPTHLPKALPKGMLEKKSVSEYEFTFTTDGSFVRIHCPLNVLMETRWRIRNASGGGLELEEKVNAHCYRFLAPLVKGELEKNWKEVHQKILIRKG
ncbi:hypothetical protein CGRA01v4_01737 [Colletotrichum graminicola]|uniref:DUF7053 domain-containing protein n=1 Tax=Colletotrichum graminicola (strain M1.001 / M2 / FGSC 10212) TaxID=645133 RepID=E3QWA9_COLGM|nr:uncharacterized protein GLRG_10287 [Colletotrichum graminicola M1.001]EFQ35143.1 hypothetical protein GLRG_10287 [Colletotrichum graminicola M1.001]WDK10458.1 hypothetical protein CGRA01v4_01737 [Colletotrichum graminicola]